MHLRTKLLLLTGCILLSTGVTAQRRSASDSIWLYRPAHMRYEQSVLSVAGLMHYAADNTGTVSLGGHYEKGGLKQAQAPEKHSVASFGTEGIRALNRFKVFGRFSYQRTWDDSLAWSQMALPDNDRPYYFASRKAGKYDRQRYEMSARAAYALQPGKLFIGSGVDYLYNTSFRSVDPRPSVKDFSLALSPGIAWVRGRHTIGASLLWGYGYEDNEVDYMNSRYASNTEIYPERRSWLMMGWGYMQPRPGGQDKMEVRSDNLGAGIHHFHNGGRWQTAADLTWKRDKYAYTNPKENSLARSVWGHYTRNTWHFRLLAQQQLRHSISLQGTLRNGRDRNTYAVPPLVPALNAQNYAYRYQGLTAQYDYTRSPESRWSPAFGASAAWEHETKEDYITQHSSRYNVIAYTLSAGLYHLSAGGDRLHVRLRAGLRQPLSGEATVLPTQQTMFSTDVVYYDHYYWSSTTGSGGLQFRYITKKIFKTLPAGITVYTDYHRRLTNEPVGRDRLRSGFSINLYL